MMLTIVSNVIFEELCVYVKLSIKKVAKVLFILKAVKHIKIKLDPAPTAGIFLAAPGDRDAYSFEKQIQKL